ncbi:MAG: PEPxxWA-CTERM sorting domain-containing protein [Xanthobacteraceae bacterium]
MKAWRDVLKLLVLPALFTPAAALASPVDLPDNYYGGLNTYNNSASIGGGIYNISSADIERIGPGGSILQVVINTAFAGYAGTDYGTGYGALFITPGVNAWQPTGVAPYSTDVYRPGEWTYAATIPAIPAAGQTSGTGGLYLTGGGALGVATSNGTIVASNVYGDPITYPFAGNNGFYFRQGQAVQFTPGSVPSIAPVLWSVGTGTVTFDILDNNLLGNDFALAWAITCGNAVIQGQVDLSVSAVGVSAVPEPATWAMMVVGFASLGLVARRRRGAHRLRQPKPATVHCGGL